LTDNPTGTKIYLQPDGMVFGTISDLAEMQGATVAYSDSRQGKICYSVNLYGITLEYRFSITGIEKKRCIVRLEIIGPELGQGKEIMLRRQFALLDSMLVINADISHEGACERG